MSKVILISDIHGCANTLFRLLNQCAKLHPGARLVFLGDLIDRGPNSRAVVEFAMANKVPTCCGNHEDLALAYSPHTRRGFRAHCSSYYERDVWLYNGGEAALGNWPHFRATEDQGVPFRDGEHIPDDVLTWMQDLPAYILPTTSVDDKGRKLLASHTGYGLTAKKGVWFAALWGRRHQDGPFVADDKGEEGDDGYYRVYGHTPMKTPLFTDTWVNIDTGAAYGPRGGGVMTALVWPTKEVVQQAFDESPVELHFTIADGLLSP